MPDGAGFGPAVTDLLIYSTFIFNKLNSCVAEIIGVPLPYVKERRCVCARLQGWRLFCERKCERIIGCEISDPVAG